MNGSARGTALVVLLAGVPVLACAMLLAARGSAAAVIPWLGSVAFLLYNSLMFVFATPANRLFPLYLAMLALAAWSAGAVLRQVDVAAFGALFSRQTPVRGIAVYMWVIVALNAAAWLVKIIPAGLLLHGLSGGMPGVTAAPPPPAAARRGRLPWTLAALAGFTGAAAVWGGVELIRDGFGMPDSWLTGTPVTGWRCPALPC